MASFSSNWMQSRVELSVRSNVNFDDNDICTHTSFIPGVVVDAPHFRRRVFTSFVLHNQIKAKCTRHPPRDRIEADAVFLIHVYRIRFASPILAWRRRNENRNSIEHRVKATSMYIVQCVPRPGISYMAHCNCHRNTVRITATYLCPGRVTRSESVHRAAAFMLFVAY